MVLVLDGLSEYHARMQKENDLISSWHLLTSTATLQVRSLLEVGLNKTSGFFFFTGASATKSWENSRIFKYGLPADFLSKVQKTEGGGVPFFIRIVCLMLYLSLGDRDAYNPDPVNLVGSGSELGSVYALNNGIQNKRTICSHRTLFSELSFAIC